jgi:hypothetical protein
MDDAYNFNFVGQVTIENQVALKAGDWRDAHALELLVFEVADAANFRPALEQRDRSIERVEKMKGGNHVLVLQKSSVIGHIGIRGAT